MAKKSNKQAKAKPFVKWAGGKGKLLSQLERLLPNDFDEQPSVCYIEPFVGGGAMLFHMLQHHPNIKKAVINDINEDLVHCYRLIKDNPQVLIDRLRDIEDVYYATDVTGRESLYYAYREQYNMPGINPDERAALLIFLNHTCYNGLFRVNASGGFNVPCGHYKSPVICNDRLILEDHRLLNSIETVIMPPGDYHHIVDHTEHGRFNFIYFDPPYRPLSATSNFKEYSKSPFGDKQQEELKLFCDQLTEQGCHIMLSNSDSRNDDGESYFEELYDRYHFERVYAPRAINASPDKRIKLSEVLIRNYN